MSLDLGNLSAPVANVDDLVGYIKGAERPPDRWLIGVEHEKIGVRVPGCQAVPYHGAGGIRELLDAIARSAGGTQHKHKENGQPIALLSKDARAPTWTSATRCGARRTTPAAVCWSRCCSPGGAIGGTSSGPSTSPCCSFATGANTATPAVRPSAAG